MKKQVKKINDLLEMPKEVYSNVPKITIIGFEDLIIENYKSILDYEDYFVRINTEIGIININGFNLQLEKMTNEDIKIFGKIENIDIENIED